jgi:UDP-N-acetylglucosamine--N-acetylmuramyl-(pentapeptide) pyrophosphoryl-undecaprenol N-acetylglucosamine transferase
VRVAFAGGGTGGHIYPALGIDDALRSAFPGRRYERRFFGNRNGLEATYVTTMPLTFVPSAPLQRSVSLGTLRILVRNAAGVAVALRALLAYRPTLVIATGGYVCFPVVVAARLLRLARLLDCRIGLVEINARPGLTNRLVSPLVDEVWVTYAESAPFFGAKARLTGAPVRASLSERIEPAQARAELGLDATATTIVVMGGSQGARSINDAVAALVTACPLPADWQLLHITGERDFAAIREREAAAPAGGRVRTVAYLTDPGNAYAAADIVVARAGASTLAELALTGTPAVLVPYPYAAEDHQTANAALFARSGAGVVLRDAELSAASLAAVLRDCLAPARLAGMRAAAAVLSPAGAANRIVDRITAILRPRVADSGSPNDDARD